jgi:putative flippase GtrA
MPSEADHIAMANTNHCTLLYLLGQHANHPEWIATVAFYKALHLTEAVLHARWGMDSSNHNQRLETVKRMMGVKYHVNFHVLYQKSRIARYLQDSGSRTNYSRFTDHLSADQVV